MPTSSWPVLTRYDQDHLARIMMPLGGIGTGTISFCGRGDLQDWEVMDRPAKYTPQWSFAALWAKPAKGPAVTRCLEGRLHLPPEGPSGSSANNHGLPRFRDCRFLAAYPFGQVELADPEVPLRVTVQAFNPLIPGDAEDSGLPIVALRYVLRNPGKTPVKAAVCWSMQNFIGHEHNVAKPKQNRNQWRAGKAARGIFMSSDGVEKTAPQWGTMALATTAGGEVTHRTRWSEPGWSTDLLDFWDDLSEDGRLEERSGEGDAPFASLAPMVTVPARGESAVTFLIAWHFPNRRSWTQLRSPEHPHGHGPLPTIGNHYTTEFRDAWDVIERVAPRLPELEERSLAFTRAFCSADLPLPVKDAALANLSTLRTQTAFRLPDGKLFGWEGCFDYEGSCWGSCTHVWNYEMTTPYLFGGLARTMREVEFAHCTDPETGHMCFRTDLPLSGARGWIIAAADGQMGTLIKLYREWQLSGDEAMLRRLWPNARKALEFCWIAGGWDADRDGVMEGCQHNTMDVEYYGPNPEIGFWYLGALRAGEEMARHLGEEDFARQCRELFTRGSRWMDQHLFNGGWYEQEVRPVAREQDIAPGLRTSMGSKKLDDPDFQLGTGCLVDQLVGQAHARACGLGHLADPKKVRAALASIKRHNFRHGLADHFNHMRTYAAGDESGLLVTTFPRGGRPKRPFPYFSEVWTGLEYTAAIGMIQEGLDADGLDCIAAVRARHDGARRNPFDEAECGHHYARAMAAWGTMLALTGFQFSAVTGTMAFRAARKPTRWFWSNGSAWGTVAQRPGGQARLEVLHGELTLRRFELTGLGVAEFGEPLRLKAGSSADIRVTRPARKAASRRREPALSR
jgi:uncharacterized protein (DUF608 family)